MRIRIPSLLLVVAVMIGCRTGEPPSGTAITKQFSPDQPIRATATIGMIADAVAQVGGPLVQVTGLMGPGVDPHLYKASQGDIARLSDADIIFYNGLNLEGKMGDIFVKLARTKPTVAVTDSLDPAQLREPPEFQGHYDPHVWFDVALWSHTIDRIVQALAEIAPAHAATFKENGARYQMELRRLHEWCRTELATIPKAQRVLITAHDAFGYFGRAYDVEVIGLQGISTVSEFGLNDVERLVQLLVDRKIRAVFVESSIPQRSIEAVVEGVRARGHAVTIGGTLFSDAMGDAGTPEGTYVGMVQANVRTIVRALAGTAGQP